jgi:hypothetical protein
MITPDAPMGNAFPEDKAMTQRAKRIRLGAVSIVFAMGLVFAPRMGTTEARCDRIVPVVDGIDLFGTATDASPSKQMTKSSLGPVFT